MNKKILMGAALAMAASSFAFTTWIGDEGSYQVNTGLANTTKTAGYWFSYTDKDDGGQSKVTWPVDLGNEYSPDAMDPVIEYCAGVCGVATLATGTLTYQPFVGIGFNIVGETSEEDNTPAAGDATDWGGVCIAYSSDIQPVLEMGLGDAKDKELAYDNPAFKLAKSPSGVVKQVAWSDFEQAGWGLDQDGIEISSAAAAQILVAVKFKLQSDDGDYNFNIMSIGPFTGGECRLTTPSPDPGPGAVKGVRAASAAKAIVSNSTLSFTGISSTASVEVINLQGQVMMKSTINASSTLDLSRLNAGIYMVRVAGKSVDFTSKIVLK